MRIDTLPFSEETRKALEETLPFCFTESGQFNLCRGRGGDALYSAEAKPWRDVKDFEAAPECTGSPIQRLNKMSDQLKKENP